MTAKPKLSFWQIWNMSFGFLGIQFGFALQGGFMSRIFQTLGAEEQDIPMLWIAAPLTGFLVQPIIGYLSDRTWSVRFGRRRPYFLVGAILSSITLFFVPHSPMLWVAAGCLWVLDASINISMEPFRALVADKLPDSQRSYGFVMQTLIIGVGTWVASFLPKLVTMLGVSNEAPSGIVPPSVQIAFAIGGFVFLASILVTVFTTKEDPPEDMEAFLREKEETKGVFNAFKEIGQNIFSMPKTMIKLGVIQFFSWFAFFAMWSMATPALTEHIYKAPAVQESNYQIEIPAQKEAYEKANKAYNDAADNVGAYMGIYGLSSMVFALLLTVYTSQRRINRKYVHMASLITGGVGFILMYFIPESWMLGICFALIGIAWGSILSMPYAMLSSAIDPKKMGLYMGIFNMFIVIPQIIAATGGLNAIYKNLLGDQAIFAIVLAGVSLILAGLSNFLIVNKQAISYQPEG
ncbi:MAG: MFS transporter [Bacteroidetes bacterium]|nr:MFS transporter [Bacteroidota bacterium]